MSEPDLSQRSSLFQHASLLKLTRENPTGISAASHTFEDGVKVSLLDTGVVQVEPANASEKSIVISSGVHGNETAPIEIVDTLLKQIIQGELKVANRLLFIIGNPVAMNKSQRFEIENMNRLFCGKHAKSEHFEAERAKKLENFVRGFFERAPQTERFHYDLHTAIRGSKYKKFAIYPYPDGRDWDKQQLSFFLACDINCILLGHQPAGTFSYFSSHEFNAHAFTVELGQVKPFGQNNMADYQAITRNLSELISGKKIDLKPFDNEDFNLFQVKEELLRHSEKAFKLNIADDLDNFSEFPSGFQLTEDSNGGYTTQLEGEAIVFPNAKVPVGHRAGLIVMKTTI